MDFKLFSRFFSQLSFLIEYLITSKNQGPNLHMFHYLWLCRKNEMEIAPIYGFTNSEM